MLYKKFLLYILILTSISCTHTKNFQKESITEGNVFELNEVTFHRKGKKIKQLNGSIKKSDGKTIAQYHISTLCRCVGKIEYDSVVSVYKLTKGDDRGIPLSEIDKFVLNKFSSFSRIETYCSKDLLLSADGFIKGFNGEK